MDPVPLGLGLTLIAIILYLLSELNGAKRDLELANRELETYRRSASGARLAPSGEQRLLIEPRAERGDQVEVAMIESTPSAVR